MIPRITVVQDGSKSYHERCAGTMSLSPQACWLEIWELPYNAAQQTCAACQQRLYPTL